MGWLAKSFIAMMAFVPGIILTEFIGRYYHIKPLLMAGVWFLGVTLGLWAWLWYTKEASGITFSMPLFSMFIGGLIFGALVNVMLFSAILIAPNAALPVAIVNSAALVVFIATILLAVFLPQYFLRVPFSSYHFFGIILIIVGVGLLSLK